MVAATADNRLQQTSMKNLRGLATARQERLCLTIALYRTGDHAGAAEPKQLGIGKALMDQIRDVVTCGPPSSSPGISRPCQCTVVSAVRPFATDIFTSSPRLTLSVGPR